MKEVHILFIDGSPVVYEILEEAQHDAKEFGKKHKVQLYEHITMFTAAKEYLELKEGK